MIIEFTYENDDGDEESFELPARFEVCDRCQGHGTHLNPSIGEHAYTWQEFNESFDEEGRAEYFRHGGIYDVTCEECRGARVVKVVDLEACARSPELTEALRLYDEKLELEARYAREEAAERRWGA